MWHHFFPLLFPKDSESLKILDIRLREVGAKRPLNGTSKVNRQTDTHTHRHMDKSTYRKHRPKGPMLWKLLGVIFSSVLLFIWNMKHGQCIFSSCFVRYLTKIFVFVFTNSRFTRKKHNHRISWLQKVDRPYF